MQLCSKLIFSCHTTHKLMYILIFDIFQMLASSLNDMFENLEIHEDCYGVGHFAKTVASELAGLPAAKARRKVTQSTHELLIIG